MPKPDPRGRLDDLLRTVQPLFRAKENLVAEEARGTRMHDGLESARGRAQGTGKTLLETLEVAHGTEKGGPKREVLLRLTEFASV